MAIKCYNKPARKRQRVFTAKDVGRICCYAIDDGALRSEIVDAVNKCLNDGVEDCETVRQENENWRKVAISIGAIAALIALRQGAIILAAQIAARLAVTEQFKKLMARIVENERESKKALDDLLRRIRESEIVLPVR